MRLSTASVFVVHLLVLVLCSEARLGGFDPLGVSRTDVKLPGPYQRRILEEQVVLTDSTTPEAEVKEVKEINEEPKPEDKNEAIQQQKGEASPANNDVDKSEEKGEDKGKPSEDSKEEKGEEQLKPVEVVKEEKIEEQLKPADEAKEENKEEQSKPADEVMKAKTEDEGKPVDENKEKEKEKEEQKLLEESKEKEVVENMEPKADQEDKPGKSIEGQISLEERKDVGTNEDKSDKRSLEENEEGKEVKSGSTVEQEKEDNKADVEAAAKAQKKEEEERKIKEKEKQLKAEQKEAAKLQEKLEKAKAQENKEAAKAKEKIEGKKKEEMIESKDEGDAAAGDAQIVESMERAKDKTVQVEHKEGGGEKIQMSTWEVKDSPDTEKKISQSAPKLEEDRSQRTDEGNKSEEQVKNEAIPAKVQDSSKRSGPKESEDDSFPELRVAATDADEDYPDFLEELRNFPERFHKTAESVKDHIRYSGLDLNRYSTHSKELFNQANHQIQESFTPLLGKDYAPAIAYIVSYGLLLLPLALVMYLLDRVRAIFSLQKVLFFINIYLSAYFAALLAATFILDSEPMSFFMKYSSSSYIFLQLLQAFGYLAYLLLNTIDLLSTCSGGRFAAKFSATVQFFVVVAVGFHYYVTVFHRAMERKAPITGWKIYGLYSASFFFLCLFARIERGKKQYPPVEQDDETDKKN